MKIKKILPNWLKAFLKGLLFRLRWLPDKIDFNLSGSGEPWKIFTHLTVAERLLLYRLGKQQPPGAVLVEIGSYLGASSCFLAAAARKRGGKLHCIDTWDNKGMSEGKRDTWEEFSRNTGRFADEIITHRGKSTEISKIFNHQIDLLFIDGDHSYEMCKSDIEAWTPYLKKGGILIMHDYTWAEGVNRVVNEIIRPRQIDIGHVIQNTYWTIL